MWFFNELGLGFVRRTSHEEEFFNRSTKVDSFVREAIQNSMDAKKENANLVRISFFIGRTENNVDEFLFEGLPEHLKASGIGVDNNIGHVGISFLAIEDFGTTGLGGSLDQKNAGSQTEDFYNFWWADGSMRKGGKSGGRWGLGKYTFFVLSEIKSFWGLTVRGEKPEKVLMGRSLLKPHRIGPTLYNLDGFYAGSAEFDPVIGGVNLRKFEELFNLSRKFESGLSIVIPLPLKEIDADGIVGAVLDHYLYPVVTGKIIVEISEKGFRETVKKNTISQDSVMELLKQKSHSEPDKFNRYLHIAKLFENIPDLPLDCALQIEDRKKPDLTEESFGESIDGIREKFDSLSVKKTIKLRVPICIEENTGTGAWTHYDIILSKIEENKKTEVFCLRSGILVTDAIKLSAGPMTVVLLAEDEIINQFLGDAENPAHKEWRPNSERFAGKYKDGGAKLRFITESVGRIIDILQKGATKKDLDLLSDVFFIEEAKEKEPGKKTVLKPDIKIKRTPDLFLINKTNGGFSVFVNNNIFDEKREGENFPVRCKVESAYVVRHGNPLKKYDPNDFDFGGEDINISTADTGEIEEANGNRLILRFDSKDFKVHLTGFDTNRDVYVSVRKVGKGELFDR